MTSVPNLASRPFRNERLPGSLFAVAMLLLLAFTVRHALELSRLPARSTALHKEVATLEVDATRLREDAKRLRGPKPDAATVGQWTLLKDLVDKRAFSWTRLLGRLESVLPDGVRLIAIDPSVKKGEMRIELTAVCRSAEDSLTLVRVLEASDEFEDVYPIADTGGEGGEARYTMRYRQPELNTSVSAASVAPVKPADAPGGAGSAAGGADSTGGDSTLADGAIQNAGAGKAVQP